MLRDSISEPEKEGSENMSRNKRGIVGGWQRKAEAVAVLLDAAKDWPGDNPRLAEAYQAMREAQERYRRLFAEDKEKRKACARAFENAKRVGLSHHDIADAIGEALTKDLEAIAGTKRERRVRRPKQDEGSADELDEALSEAYATDEAVGWPA